MSRTDNTRPLLLQWADTTLPGGMNHHHHGQACDYSPRHNVVMFRDSMQDHCGRIAYRYGGKRSEVITKIDRKQASQGIRRHKRQVLYDLKRSGNFEDFDMMPSPFEYWA
jgi:hypothetical protein